MIRERVLAELRRYFADAGEGLVAVYLFGSVARGDERKDSDIDVGVVTAPSALDSLADIEPLALLADDLSAMLRKPVDVVRLNRAAPDLVHRMLCDGVLVFEGDREARIEFEVNARNAYFDIAPALERYRREVLRRA